MKNILAPLAAAWAYCMAFGHAHPLIVAAALVSLAGSLHDYLDKFPRVQAVAKVARGLGIDYQTVVAGFVQLVTGVSKAAVAAAASTVAAILLVASVVGCAPGAPAKTAAQAHADAYAALSSVESAWLVTAQLCENVAAVKGGSDGDQILAGCAAILDPLRVDMEAADDTVNAWGSATSNAALNCKLVSMAASIGDAAKLLGTPPNDVATAQAVVDALVSGYGGACADGGAK